MIFEANIDNKNLDFKKSIRYLFGIFLLLVLFTPQKLQATHIVGGEINYRCLGNNQYEIIMTVYRDCYYGDPNAGFDDPAFIGFFRSDNLPATNVGSNGYIKVPYDATDTLDGQITSECKVIGQDICVHRAVYRTIVSLPMISGGYTAVYQRCCRNQTILNIQDPLNTGAIFSVKITENALQSCNSSPAYPTWPPIYICANKAIEYDHSAFDEEGDSIVYRLCTPLVAGDSTHEKIEPPPKPPYDSVIWINGYNLSNLLGGPNPLTIHPNTGFLTGTPPTVGQFLVGVCIDEYRNGVLLSNLRRDFQYNVRECTNPTNACFFVPNPICNTFDVNFTNCSEGAISYKWYFDFENDQNVNSTEFEPTHNYPGPGTYTVRLIAMEDKRCIDTFTNTITLVNSIINADFSLSVPSCSSTVSIKTQNLSTGANSAKWFLTKGANLIETSNQIQPTFEVTEAGEYCITLIVANKIGCLDTIEKCITVQPLNNIIQNRLYTICKGESQQLNPSNPNPDLIYTWSPATFLGPGQIDSPNPTSTPNVNIDYTVTILDPKTNCSYVDTVKIRLKQEPSLSFSFENECGSLFVKFKNTSANATDFTWNFGDGSPEVSTLDPTHLYTQEGTYTVILSNTDGCQRSITQEISINLIDTTLINDSIFICKGGKVNLNPNGDPNYKYIWSPAGLLDNPNSANPEATITNYTVFTVQISDPSFSDCVVPGRVAVDLPVYNSNVNNNQLICQTAEIPITFNYLSGPLLSSIHWRPDTRILSGQGTNTIEVLAIDDITYIAEITLENGCIFEDTSFINVSEVGGQIEATINIDSIFQSQQAQLNVIPFDPSFEYTWTPAEGLSDPNIANPIAKPTEPGSYNYTVVVTNSDGCILSGQVTLVVRETICDEKHVFLPNAFSPNGKGLTTNESLKLYSNYVESVKLIIYNRFGQEVFTTLDPNFEWNGTFNGKELDPDVYGYYLEAECVGGEHFTKKGNITLVR